MYVSGNIYSSDGLYPSDYHTNPRVARYIDRYTAEDLKGWLESVFQRASLYRGYVLERIRELQVPEALFYLPVVESGYNPKAVSPSGASGMWQFMMNSIGPYDLRVDQWIDERKDFWKSTTASLTKLSYNRQVLGDWLLAIAAYNCGLGRMQRAIKEAGSSDFWTLVDGGFLPAETARYVPKFLAIAHIGSNLQKYEFTEIEAPVWKWRRLQVDGQVNLRTLAKKVNIPESILLMGNAELIYPVTPPEGYSYYLKVPDICSDVIYRTLQGDLETLNRFYIHNVRPGDTLYALARHFGVSVDLIKMHNPGIEPRFLHINSILLVPVVNDIGSLPVSNTIGNHQGRRRYASTRYIVKAGDTLWDISRRFRISLEDLTSINDLSLQRPIHPGQVLDIPVVIGAISE